ncbi:hypothetical protein C2G38_2065597 [Gigaspora rosea]|uniref:Serine-threonine/tyrosine-protein kinase catalytic domain-containing protein n=1 Tax=Gigaspora rosea TaxID=44941 RepID=A0A397VUC6_9GLOM|nr:hypothetical protein C2G38_2065597 [Gigaspora rosea]
MVEMTTGQRSFNNYKFNIDLAVLICNGLRPKFALGTPDCYIELANQCMNSDPEKRPSITEIITKLDEWLNIIKNESEIIGEIITELDKRWNIIKNEGESRNENQFLERWLNIIENESRIKNQFLESDEISKNLPIILKKLSKSSYASKPYNTSEIGRRLSRKHAIKSTGNIKVPDDFCESVIFKQ